MRALERSVNATSCNVVTVPPHDVIQKKMTPWVQLTAEGTWPHDRCVWGGSGYCGERPPHTVIGRVRLPRWGAKEGEKQLDFFFFVPQVIVQTSLSIFVPYSLIWLYTQVITAHYHGYKQKKTSQTETAEQRIIFNTAGDEFPLFL